MSGGIARLHGNGDLDQRLRPAPARCPVQRGCQLPAAPQDANALDLAADLAPVNRDEAGAAAAQPSGDCAEHQERLTGVGHLADAPQAEGDADAEAGRNRTTCERLCCQVIDDALEARLRVFSRPVPPPFWTPLRRAIVAAIASVITGVTLYAVLGAPWWVAILGVVAAHGAVEVVSRLSAPTRAR
jgi:hypothetical protein